MQASHAFTGGQPVSVVPMNRRVVTAATVVVALHASLIAVMLSNHDVATPVAIESHTITAELLQPEPLAAPAALQSMPTPAPPKPAAQIVREKPKAQPKPRVTPTPLPLAQAPSQHQIDTPAPASPAPSAPAAPAAASPAPPAPGTSAAPAAAAPGKPTITLSAPKNVSHLDCQIAHPDYPKLSMRRGETGTAYVRFVVGVSGQIENVELKKSSGYSRLDDAALAAMHDSSCKPYLENGEPVRAAYTQPFAFNLQD
ncbi:MAG TPA: energy transducer TonB [Paraburkholderia sp.]|jgi:protein TonB|nr:energy transducer TonB [Paraburkholderia sp.]